MKYWYLFVSTISCVILYQFLEGGTLLEKIVTAITFGLITGVSVFPFAEIKRRIDNGIDIFATLESDPEKVKAHMLFIMQYGHYKGIAGALKEFNDIFRNYPQWRLGDWEVFRAWYKDLIDRALKNPEIYVLTMKDGSEYNKDIDPLYDPEAPDWEQYDRQYSYDNDEDNDKEDYYDGDNSDLQNVAEESFYTGIGLGATDNCLNR